MDCLFCKMVNGEIPTKKIYEDENVIVILDLHPSSDGHSLVIPKKHITDMMELDNEDLVNVYSVAKKISPILMDKMNAKGLSLRINYGDSQEIKHFHLHVLPNYQISKPKLSQNEAYDILKDAI